MSPSIVTVRASDRRRVVTLAVLVKASGVAAVSGKVRTSALRGLNTVSLVTGRVTVRLRRQPKGTWNYKASYLGAGPVLPGSKTVRVAV